MSFTKNLLLRVMFEGGRFMREQHNQQIFKAILPTLTHDLLYLYNLITLFYKTHYVEGGEKWTNLRECFRWLLAFLYLKKREIKKLKTHIDVLSKGLKPGFINITFKKHMFYFDPSFSSKCKQFSFQSITRGCVLV